jgi:hypothetical protein
MWIRVAAAKRVAIPGNGPLTAGFEEERKRGEEVLNTKEAWASKLRARLIDLTVPPAPNPQLSDGAGQALRLILWIMSAMWSLSCVPRFLSLLAIRTRSVAV